MALKDNGKKANCLFLMTPCCMKHGTKPMTRGSYCCSICSRPVYCIKYKSENMRKYGAALFAPFFSLLSLAHLNSNAQSRLSGSQPIAQGNISPDALRYFNDAFSQVRDHALKKKSIDFDQLYKESLEKMKNAQTYKDTYDAIRY